MKPRIAIKRVYETPSKTDGRRILVDRLWPRGLTRDASAIDEWKKEVAPSTALRRWFNHDPARWNEFLQRYRTELEAPAAKHVLKHLRTLAGSRKVTLVYAAADSEHNNAAALRIIMGATPEDK